MHFDMLASLLPSWNQQGQGGWWFPVLHADADSGSRQASALSGEIPEASAAGRTMDGVAAAAARGQGTLTTDERDHQRIFICIVTELD